MEASRGQVIGNLRPVSHTFSREEQSRGGKASTVAKSLSQRTTCGRLCPIFLRCPLKSMGIKMDKLPSGAIPCALNKQPDWMKNRIISLFNDGRDGVIAEMQQVLYDLSIDVDKTGGSVKTRAIYFEKLADFLEKVYGKVIHADVKASVSGITAADFAAAFEEVKKEEKHGD